MPPHLPVYRAPATRRYPWIMPASPATSAPARLDAAWWNARIRRFAGGRVVWSPEALAEYARMRARWQAAVEAEKDPG